MTTQSSIGLKSEDFDVGEELFDLRKGKFEIGGVCSFVGLVRDMAGGKPVLGMTLEHYPGMTEKALAEIDREAHNRWPLVETKIIHRYGSLKPGDQIVLVCTASPHRKAAIEACHFLIDWLKTKAPFWKCEQNPDGFEWVEERAKDKQEEQKWGS